MLKYKDYPVINLEKVVSIEVIDIINALIESSALPKSCLFNLGNVIKYILRAGKKENEPILKDLKKARDYIDFMIREVEKEKTKNKRKKRIYGTN